jgi:hypothetical protein
MTQVTRDPESRRGTHLPRQRRIHRPGEYVHAASRPVGSDVIGHLGRAGSVSLIFDASKRPKGPYFDIRCPYCGAPRHT